MGNKARATRRNAERAAAKPTLRLVPKTRPMVERTGLQWLLHKGQINEAECRAGIRYGKDYRATLTNGMEPIKSCIASDIGGGGVASSMILQSQAEFSADTLTRLQDAREAIHDPDMIEALDACCGRQLTPRQIDPNQRASERITITLRHALRQLVRHYGASA